jgi:hypothetical protein
VQRPALCGEAQREVAPVDLVDTALHQALRDQAIDETARAVAGLADEQTAECVQRQRSVIPQDPEDFGLRRRDSERA